MTEDSKANSGESNQATHPDVDFSQLDASHRIEGQEMVSNIAGMAEDNAQDGGEEGASGSAATGVDVGQLMRERDEFQDKYLRALADADNIRKRAMRERADLLKYQGEQIVTDLLTVVDDFELALTHSGAELDKFKQGIEMIHKRFIDVLGKWEVRGESAIGKAFDPNRHEALSKIPAADAPSGSVVNELKKAFFYKDKLIRPGQVVVAE